MMAYKEKPNVTYQNHRFKFDEIEWLNIDTFKKRLEQGPVYPYVETIDSQRVYVGKPLSKISYINDDDNNITIVQNENIGSVKKSLNGSWELILVNTDDSSLEILTKDFLILSIQNPNSFEWIDAQSEMIPKYAIRDIDSKLKRFVYIGKPICDGYNKSRRSLNFFQTDKNDEVIVPNIGKIDSIEGVLCVTNTFNKNEICKYTTFSVLCMKPSPASLKELCRLKIRKLCLFNNLNILELKKNLSTYYINYLQYPKYLYVNEILLPGDKLISQCGQYELYIIDFNNNNASDASDSANKDIISSLVFRHVKTETAHDFELENVESIILQQNSILICFTNDKIFHRFCSLNYNKAITYRMNLTFEEFRDAPLSIIEEIDENGEFYPTYTQDFLKIKDYASCGSRFRGQPGERIYDDTYSDEGDENQDYMDNYGDYDDDYDSDDFEYDFS